MEVHLHCKSGVSSSVAGASVSRHLRHAGASVLDATGGVSEVPRLYSPSVPRWCLLWWGHSEAAARWASPCLSECLSWAAPRASPLTSSAVSPGQLIVMPHQYVRAWVWVRVNCDGGISKHQLRNWQVGPASGRQSPVPALRRCLSLLTISHSSNNIYTSYQTPSAGCSQTEIVDQTDSSGGTGQREMNH